MKLERREFTVLGMISAALLCRPRLPKSEKPHLREILETRVKELEAEGVYEDHYEDHRDPIPVDPNFSRCTRAHGEIFFGKDGEYYRENFSFEYNAYKANLAYLTEKQRFEVLSLPYKLNNTIESDKPLGTIPFRRT